MSVISDIYLLNVSVVAFLDSSVLYPSPLSEVLIYAAEAYLFVPRFSQEVLDEVADMWVKHHQFTQEEATDASNQLIDIFPEGLIDFPTQLSSVMDNHPSDRHVLAAAYASRSDVIVTFNTDHFQDEHLDPWNVRAIHPDDFLCEICNQVGRPKLFKLVKQIANDADESDISVLDKLYKRGVANFSSYVTTHGFSKDIARIAVRILREKKEILPSSSFSYSGDTYNIQSIEGKLQIQTKEGRVLFKALREHSAKTRIIPEDAINFLAFEDGFEQLSAEHKAKLLLSEEERSRFESETVEV